MALIRNSDSTFSVAGDKSGRKFGSRDAALTYSKNLQFEETDRMSDLIKHDGRHFITTDSQKWGNEEVAILHQKELTKQARTTDPFFGHADTRSLRNKIDDHAWKPPKRQRDLPHEADLEEFERKAAAKRREDKIMATKDVDERTYLIKKYQQQDFILAEEAAERKAQHLAANQTEIDVATRLLNRRIHSDDASVSDIIAAQRVVQCLQEPDACPIETKKLFTALREGENKQVNEKAQALLAAKAELDAEYQAAVANLIADNEQTETEAADVSDESN